MTVRREGSTSSSTMMSTAVVRGLSVVECDGLTTGLGKAAMRVLAGGGTVTSWVMVTVWVSVS